MLHGLYFGLESGGQSGLTFSGLPPLCTVGAAEFEPPASGSTAQSTPRTQNLAGVRPERIAWPATVATTAWEMIEGTGHQTLRSDSVTKKP